jgi:16S rRNA (guanine966-N2)-methyltransferase
MRVITGELKGRTIRVPGDAAFRPTTDRVKESIFNILAGSVDWERSTVCDLFAGSGSLGIEALSRGAVRACFVEQNRKTVAVLERNIAALGLDGRARIEADDVERFLARATDRFSLVLADPPYRYPKTVQVLERIPAVLDAGGVAVLEHEGAQRWTDTRALRVIDRREYGTTAVTFFQPMNGEAS